MGNRFLAGLSAVGFAALVGAGAEGNVSPVAVTGQTAPGAGAGFTFHGFYASPTINNAGQVVFEATLALDGTEDPADTSIWLGTSNASTLIARSGDQAVGIPGGQFGFVQNALSSAGGQVLFSASIPGTGDPGNAIPDDIGLWTSTNGSVSLVMRQGAPAAGVAGATYGQPGDLGILPNGSVRFGADLSTGGRGFWTTTDGNANLVAQPAGRGVHNVNGAVALVGAAGPDSAVLAGPVGSLQVVARAGQAAAQVSGYVYQDFDNLALNASGRLLLEGSVRPPGAPDGSGDRRALWVGDAAGALQLLVQAESGSLTSLQAGQLNDAGTVAFQGEVALGGGSQAGIWRTVGASTSLVEQVMITGDPAVGTDGTFLSLDGYRLNNAGQIAFKALFEEAGGEQFSGIWLADDTGLHLLVREGQTVDVNGTPYLIGANRLGWGGALNDLGEVAFIVDFRDDNGNGPTGIYLASVPEPGTALLGSLMGMALLLRRTRRQPSES